MYKLRKTWKIDLITVTALMTVFFISCLAALSGAYARTNVILLDMKAEHVSGNIALILDADNIDNAYVKATPVITVYSRGEIVINKYPGQYILLPNRTNRITVHYSRSLFSEGNYTIESKLVYDKTESNTLLKTLMVSGDELTMGNAKEIVAPVPVQLNAGDYGGQLPYFIIMLLSVIVIFLSVNWFRRVKTKTEGADGIRVNGDIGMTKDNSDGNGNWDDSGCEMRQDMNREIVSRGTVSDSVEEEKDENTYPGKDCEGAYAGSCRVLGKDVIHAISEEKERLKEEINDLDMLYKKNILDADIFEKNKKDVEDKLEQISVESLLNSERCAPELKDNIAEKLKHREEKIVSSIDMLDKLYSDGLIDEEMYEKNKNDLKNAMDKLRNINRRMQD